ncbi:alpha-mannosidase 2x-like isoform X2 [Mya arenaria]|uniref:alpha-mannosidase 2x-like isoform X2 n=1 Tax=Mya arenaria TaxID=6604 RepID=UPI0022E6E734|nr:alpha-mannosidase 2x-like isoform X2 [Mya arenaria]
MRLPWRRMRRKWRTRIAVLVIAAFVATNFFLVTRIRPQTVRTWIRDTGLFQIRYDPFGSSLSARACPLSQEVAVTRSRGSQEFPVCTMEDYSSHADIQMEAVWDSVSVGYPNLVVSVTGWVDTVRVDHWTNKPLTVILVPHSHQDPGWLKTMESYFGSFTRGTLDTAVDMLTSHPTWTFVWAEVVFLRMWWEGASMDRREKFKKLLASGRLEVVTGGHVMPDESLTHFAAILESLVQGQSWLKDTLNYTVENGWAIDPFGHSSTMAYLLHEAGIKNTVLQRAHFAVKREFARKRQLEFRWRQAWDPKGRHDVFCHLFPFLLYSIPYSCGPERHVCCQFDFHKRQCFRGTEKVPLLEVTKENVERLSWDLYEQLQKKAELYRSNVVLLPHGDDFRYATEADWRAQMSNMQALMDHINNNTQMAMKIQFGTLRTYFDAVHAEARESRLAFPVLSGDLVPYSDRGDQYWAGFYTSRPFIKYLARRLQSLLRSTEILYTFSSSLLGFDANMTSLYSKLEASRRTLAIVQHHDAITGTSKKDVMNDYRKKIADSIRDTGSILTSSAESLVRHKIGTQSVKIIYADGGLMQISQKELPVRLLVWNSLGKKRKEVASILIDTGNVTVTRDGSMTVPAQLGPAWQEDGAVNRKLFQLSSYVIMQSTGVAKNQTSLYRVVEDTAHVQPNSSGLFPAKMMKTGEFSLSNDVISGTFSKCTGLLQSVQNLASGQRYDAAMSFVSYTTGQKGHPFRDKSGAYIFLPDGVAQYITEKPTVWLVKGVLFSQVWAVYKDFTLVTTVYEGNHSELRAGIDVEAHFNIGSSRWDNKELALRIHTNVFNEELAFCTDVNGFQLHKRKTRKKMTIQGNFYPMTTMAMIESTDLRVTLLSSYSHAVASLASGYLEVILDRRLIQDDWRGLNEGIKDNVPTSSRLFLLFEEQQKPLQNLKRNTMCFPSASAEKVSDLINNELSILKSTPFHPFVKRRSRESEGDPFEVKLVRDYDWLPCAHLVNLRLAYSNSMKSSSAMLTLQRKQLDCFVQDILPGCRHNKTATIDLTRLQLPKYSVTEITSKGSPDGFSRNAETMPLRDMSLMNYKINFK